MSGPLQPGCIRSGVVQASRAVLQACFHEEGSEDLLPPHAMPAAMRVCGKLAVLDNVLSKLLAAKHKLSQHHHFSMPPHCDTRTASMPRLLLWQMLYATVQSIQSIRAPKAVLTGEVNKSEVQCLSALPRPYRTAPAGAHLQHNDTAAGHPGGSSGLARHQHRAPGRRHSLI